MTYVNKTDIHPEKLTPEPIVGSSIGAVASGASAGAAVGAAVGVMAGSLPGMAAGITIGGVAGALASEWAAETINPASNDVKPDTDHYSPEKQPSLYYVHKEGCSNTYVPVPDHDALSDIGGGHDLFDPLTPEAIKKPK